MERQEFNRLERALEKLEHQSEEQTKLLGMIVCLLKRENPELEYFLPPKSVSVEPA